MNKVQTSKNWLKSTNTYLLARENNAEIGMEKNPAEPPKIKLS